MTDLKLLLSPELIASLRKSVSTAELQGNLSAEQLAVIHKQKWFHLFVPEKFGGLALSLPEAVRLEESIAYADGSVGWVVTLCAGAAMFVGYFTEDLAQQIFTTPFVCLAGSGQSNGSATTIAGGFEINGAWPYASGAPNATHFTANCIIEDTGEIQSFVFTSDEVSLHANWQYIGLNATAGYSFSVKDLQLPASRGFLIDPAFAVLPDAVYRYPFLQLAETTIAANISGMCLYFFELAEMMFANKQTTNPRSALAKVKGLELISSGSTAMSRLRNAFYQALDASWAAHTNCGELSSLQAGAVTETSKLLAGQSRNLVNQLYPYCGLDAARIDHPINQVWRNINTASQHTLLLDVS